MSGEMIFKETGLVSLSAKGSNLLLRTLSWFFTIKIKFNFLDVLLFFYFVNEVLSQKILFLTLPFKNKINVKSIPPFFFFFFF